MLTSNYWFSVGGAESCVSTTCYMQILLTSAGSNQSGEHMYSEHVALPGIAGEEKLDKLVLRN